MVDRGRILVECAGSTTRRSATMGGSCEDASASAGTSTCRWRTTTRSSWPAPSSTTSVRSKTCAGAHSSRSRRCSYRSTEGRLPGSEPLTIRGSFAATTPTGSSSGAIPATTSWTRSRRRSRHRRGPELSTRSARSRRPTTRTFSQGRRGCSNSAVYTRASSAPGGLRRRSAKRSISTSPSTIRLRGRCTRR